MKHKSIHKKLIFFLEGELSAPEEKKLRDHLADSVECREFLEVLRKGFSIIEKEKKPEANPFFYAKLKAKMEKQVKQKSDPAYRRILQPAIFSILLIGGISLGILIGSRVDSKKSIPRQTTDAYYLNEMGSEPIESYFIN